MLLWQLLSNNVIFALMSLKHYSLRDGACQIEEARIQCPSVAFLACYGAKVIWISFILHCLLLLTLCLSDIFTEQSQILDLCTDINCGEAGCYVYNNAPRCGCTEGVTGPPPWPEPDEKLRCPAKNVSHPVRSDTKVGSHLGELTGQCLEVHPSVAHES